MAIVSPFFSCSVCKECGRGRNCYSKNVSMEGNDNEKILL